MCIHIFYLAIPLAEHAFIFNLWGPLPVWERESERAYALSLGIASCARLKVQFIKQQVNHLFSKQWVCSCKANFLCQRDVTLDSNKWGLLYTLLQTALDCTVGLSTELSNRKNNDSTGFQTPIRLFYPCVRFSFTFLFMYFLFIHPNQSFHLFLSSQFLFPFPPFFPPSLFLFNYRQALHEQQPVMVYHVAVILGSSSSIKTGYSNRKGKVPKSDSTVRDSPWSFC